MVVAVRDVMVVYAKDSRARFLLYFPLVPLMPRAVQRNPNERLAAYKAYNRTGYKKKSRKGRARTLITKGLRTPPGNPRRKMRAPNSATRIPPTTTTQGRRGAGRRRLGSVAAEMDLVGCASPREKVLPPPLSSPPPRGPRGSMNGGE